jgi:hypothetical protein
MIIRWLIKIIQFYRNPGVTFKQKNSEQRKF